jgi:hypothetical protein
MRIRWSTAVKCTRFLRNVVFCVGFKVGGRELDRGSGSGNDDDDDKSGARGCLSDCDHEIRRDRWTGSWIGASMLGIASSAGVLAILVARIGCNDKDDDDDMRKRGWKRSQDLRYHMPIHWHTERTVTGINPCIWTHCISALVRLIVCGNWWQRGGATRYTKQVYPYHIICLLNPSISFMQHVLSLDHRLNSSILRRQEHTC